jgi:uncharacterized damage-inducible protein DinB
MSNALNQNLLEVFLDSWDRNNTILINLLHILPERALDVTAMKGSPSIAKMFTHMHYTRLFFVSEDAPEFARTLPQGEPVIEKDRGRLTEMLNDSAKAVRDAVKNRIETGRDMNVRYDHPLLMIQHLIWHEGYHHGQMKLALKLAGHTIDDEEAGQVTWDVWMDKSGDRKK